MHVYGVDVGKADGDMTCFARFWLTERGELHWVDISLEEVYERGPVTLEARLVPGTNPPRFET